VYRSTQDNLDVLGARPGTVPVYNNVCMQSLTDSRRHAERLEFRIGGEPFSKGSRAPTPTPSSTVSSTIRTASSRRTEPTTPTRQKSSQGLTAPQPNAKIIRQRGTEPRAISCRNTGRLHLGIPGRLRRNPQVCPVALTKGFRRRGRAVPDGQRDRAHQCHRAARM